MNENETIEYTADEPVESPVPAFSRQVMRRSYSRMALGLCLGLLFSQLLPTLLAAVFPRFDAQAHAFLVGGLCTACFTLPVMLLAGRRLPTDRP